MFPRQQTVLCFLDCNYTFKPPIPLSKNKHTWADLLEPPNNTWWGKTGLAVIFLSVFHSHTDTMPHSLHSRFAFGDRNSWLWETPSPQARGLKFSVPVATTATRDYVLRPPPFQATLGAADPPENQELCFFVRVKETDKYGIRSSSHPCMVTH